MSKIAKLLLPVLIFLVSCSVNTANWNEHIDAASRSQIKELNNQVVVAFHENNPQKLQTVFSEQLQAKAGAEAANLVSSVHAYFSSPEYAVLDEYKSTSSAVGKVAVVAKEASEEHAYLVRFEPQTPDTYISLLTAGSDDNKLLLTCIYGKYGGNWKLNVLKVGEYSLFGNNAVDFYNQAKTSYKQGHLLDAVGSIVMLQRTAMPAEQLFQYNKDEEMKTFAKKVLTEANTRYPMPMTIREVKTEPQIFGLTAIAMNEGIFPKVDYLSHITLADTAALRQENNVLKENINRIFPGITAGHKYVFFKVYNELPNGRTPVNNFGYLLVSPQK